MALQLRSPCHGSTRVMIPPRVGGGEPPAEATTGTPTRPPEQRRAQHAQPPCVRWRGASARRRHARPPSGHGQRGAEAEEAGGSEQLRATRKRGKEERKRKKEKEKREKK